MTRLSAIDLMLVDDLVGTDPVGVSLRKAT
jgi:hypothetical protein